MPHGENREQDRGAAQRGAHVDEREPDEVRCKDDASDDVRRRHVPRVAGGVGISLGVDRPVGVEADDAMGDRGPVFVERNRLAEVVPALANEDSASRRDRRAHRPGVDDVHAVRDRSREVESEDRADEHREGDEQSGSESQLGHR